MGPRSAVPSALGTSLVRNILAAVASPAREKEPAEMLHGTSERTSEKARARVRVRTFLLAAVGLAAVLAEASPGSSASAVEQQRFSAWRQGVVSMSPPVLAPADVFGPDDRRRVLPASPIHRGLVWIGSLVDGKPYSSCSGVVVGPGVVLTAAHCVVIPRIEEEDFAITSVRVMPERDGVTGPWGSQDTARWYVPDAFRISQSAAEVFQSDYALVILPDRTMTDRSGVFPGGIAALDDPELLDTSSAFASLGYPGDCVDNRCGDAASNAIYGQGQYAWHAPASFVAPTKHFLYDDADLAGGMSGGPMIRTSDSAVVGIVSAEGTIFNRTTRISPDVAARLQGWCDEAGCTLDVAQRPNPPSRPNHRFFGGLASDGATGTCPAERAFVGLVAMGAAAFEQDAIAFVGMVVGPGFDPGSPAWRREFDAAYSALQRDVASVKSLEPPDAKFVEFHRTLDLGLDDYATAMRQARDAIEENNLFDLYSALSSLDAADLHFAQAKTAFHGVDPLCRPALAP